MMKTLDECKRAVLALLKSGPKYFNELCRLLPEYKREQVARALVYLEHYSMIFSRMKQSSFEMEKRWVREYKMSEYLKCRRK